MTEILRRNLVTGLLAVAAYSLVTMPAAGHVFAPSLLELRQTAAETFAVRWKQPEVLPAGAQARPQLPDNCQPVGDRRLQREDTGIAVLFDLRCSTGLEGSNGLEGSELGIAGLASTQASALVRVEWLDGRSVRHVLDSDAPTFIVPAKESLLQVGLSYGQLGLEHIASGFDHLLFVLGLTLLVSGRRRLFLTVTAFTLGHSVTLALAALGWVHLPQAPVEMLIALSIFVLAVELARKPAADANGGRPWSWMQRNPQWMAAGFGLFHGLGFAGALTEAGLPEGEVPAALFAFNVGIELGQLAFVALVLAFSALWARGTEACSWPKTRWALVPVYLIGCCSAFWVIERTLGLV